MKHDTGKVMTGAKGLDKEQPSHHLDSRISRAWAFLAGRSAADNGGGSSRTELVRLLRVLLGPIGKSGSPALSMIQGRQLARRSPFSSGVSDVPDRRKGVFIESAGGPDFALGPVTFRKEHCED